ncbi:MAG: Ig-like domain-containing protein [Pirellulaceae bacterium]
MDAWESQFEALGADINTIDGSRWTQTATNGGGLGQGHPSTITWSVVPDTTPISGFANEPAANSNLRARLNQLYGSSSVWLPLLQQVFDRWEAVSGIDFVYEPNDDGASFSVFNGGVLGVRGDMRLGGHYIDGNSGILAYNFYPNVGDMVLDTADSFYNTLSGNSLRLRNVVAHEAGHGIGLAHSLPVSGTKLMEPFASTNFDGPQHDDILRANRGYGDPLESNDTVGTAHNLGTLGTSPLNLTGLSIDDDSDVDFFRFDLSASSSLTLTLSPTGSIYTVGIEGGSNASFDSRAQSDLAFTVYASNGTTVQATSNTTGLGGTESLTGLTLGAGQYYVGVTGAQNAAQLYSLTLEVTTGGTDTTPPTVSSRVPDTGATVTTTSINIDVTFSEPVSGVDVGDLVLTGAGAAGATKGTPSSVGGNTWRFPVSNLTNGAVDVALAPDANDIEDAAGNDLAPVSWSFTVNLPVNQQPPVLAPIGDQTIPSSTQNGVVQLSATDPNNDPLTFSATAQSIEYHLDQTLGLGSSGGNEYLNYAGRNEKWLTGSGGLWYYITPDGQLYRWLGSSNYSSDPVVAQLSTAAYANTALLHNAQPNNAPAGVSVNGSVLTIDPQDAFTGRFVVTVTVSDGAGGTDSETFIVTVQAAGTDTTPPTVSSRVPDTGATVTTTSINIDVTFSEPVSGVDVGDLVLTGAGAAGATKGTPSSVGGNTWRFPVSNLTNGAVDVALAPDANDIEDAAGNDLAPVSWSFTVNLPVNQQPPVLAPIGDQTIPSSTQNGVVQLSATDPNNDPLTFSATAQSIEYHLDQTLGLGSSGGNEYLNYAGRNEKWLTGSGGLWYYITPDGQLYRWLGSSNYSSDPVVAQLSTAAYANTALLHNAQPNNAPAGVSVNGSVLTIDPQDAFTGRFVVTVTVSDGAGGTDSETFIVTVL